MIQKHSPSFWKKAGNLISVFGDFLNINTSNGKVGIGTNAPESKFHISGSTPVLTISGGADDREKISLKDEDLEMAYLSCSYASEGVRLWTAIEQNIGLGTSDTERITITGTGNVGINNTNPLGKFIVKGAGTTTGVTLQTQNSSGTGLITALDNGNVGFGISPSYKFQISDGSNTYATFDNSTRGLKIGRSGTLAPTKTLDIAGDINFNPIVPPTIAGVMTAVLTGVPGNVPNGTQWYTVGFYDAAGNLSVAQYSQISIVVTDKTVDGQVLLSNIPTSTDPRVVGRKIYRGGQYVQQYLATIANNTTTTYTDNLATTTASDNVYRRNNYTAGRFYSNGSVILQVPSQYVTAIGFSALQNNTTGYDVIAIGSALYQNTTGTSNIGIGSNAGASITTGTNNLAISYSALLGCNTGINNVALGDNSLRQNSTAGAYNYNTSVGSNSGLGIYVGSNYNTFLGYSAGASTWVGTAYGNTFLGSHPGTATLTSGNYNILIGYNADTPAASTSSFLNLGQAIYATGLGTGGVTPSISAKVGIGTVAPTYSLDIKGVYTTSGVSSQAGYNIELVTNPVAPTHTISAGGSVDTGVHYYFVTYTTAIGETGAGATMLATTTAGNNTVNLTIPVSTDNRVTGRKIYRTKVGSTSDNEYYLATISNNTATTYTDTAADSTLTGSPLQYYRVNSTSNYFTIGGVKSMIADNNLTAFGKDTGALLYGSYAPVRTTLFGNGAGAAITTGTANHIFGVAGRSITTGGNNHLFGDLAGYIVTTGTNNHCYGAQTGRYLTTGSYNILYGPSCGNKITTGNNNIHLGVSCGAIAANRNTNYSISIGNYAYNTKNNQMVLGGDKAYSTGYAIDETIINGDTYIKKEASTGSEVLTNPNLTGGTSWSRTNDCQLTSDTAVFSYSTGLVSTLTQTQANLATPILGNKWYKLSYTVSGVTGTPDAIITLQSSLVAFGLNVNTNGSVTTYFQSAVSPTDFIIQATLTTGQAFTIDSLSLKEVVGGNLLVNGNVGIGTTAPKSVLDVVGIPVYANNAAALAGGLQIGSFYRTGADPDPVCVVH